MPDKDLDILCTPGTSVNVPILAGKCNGNAQAKVVVAVAGAVVVAVGDPAVLSVVVPTPAAFDTVGGANGLYPNTAHHIVSGVSSKLLRNLFRKFHVSY